MHVLSLRMTFDVSDTFSRHRNCGFADTRRLRRTGTCNASQKTPRLAPLAWLWLSARRSHARTNRKCPRATLLGERALVLWAGHSAILSRALERRRLRPLLH